MEHLDDKSNAGLSVNPLKSLREALKSLGQDVTLSRDMLSVLSALFTGIKTEESLVKHH